MDVDVAHKTLLIAAAAPYTPAESLAMAAGTVIYDKLTADVEDISDFLDDIWAKMCEERGDGDAPNWSDEGDGEGAGGEGEGEGGSEASSLTNRMAGLEA